MRSAALETEAARRDRDVAAASEAAAVAAAAAAVATLEHERSVGPHHILVSPSTHPTVPRNLVPRRPFPRSPQNTHEIPIPEYVYE